MKEGDHVGRLDLDLRMILKWIHRVQKGSVAQTQPPIQWLPESLFLGVKRPGREGDHSPPSSAEGRYSTFTY
jgi:hypothetical protein